MPIDVVLIFHNGSNYDYNFVIKEQKTLKENLNVYKEIQKNITFRVTIE